MGPMHLLPRLGLVFALTLITGTAADHAEGPRPPSPLRQAWEDMRLGRWDTAERTLIPLASSREADPAAEALYATGNLWLHRKPGADPARAREAFSEVSRRFPSHPLAAWADLAIARIPDLDVLHPDPSAAAILYLGVMKRFPSSPASGEAALHRALALASSGGVEETRRTVLELEAWWIKNPQPSLACAYEATLGRLWRFPLKDSRRAAEHLRRALDLDPASLSQRQGICWTIARLAEEDLHDTALATTYYTRFAKDFPRHQNAFSAIQALQRFGAPLPPVEDASLEGLRARQAGGAR